VSVGYFMGLNTARFDFICEQSEKTKWFERLWLFDKIRNLEDKECKRVKIKVKRT
jgi:hypothetical protein